MTIEELRALVAKLEVELHTGATEIRSLSEIPDPISPEDDAKLTAALEVRAAKKAELEAAKTELAPLEARKLAIDEARALSTEKAPGYYIPQVMHRVDPTNVDVRSLNAQELRDNAMALIEKQGKRLTARQLDHLDTTVRSGTRDTDGAAIAKRILLTETDAYRSAFTKGISMAQPNWTPEESRALDEFRAMNEGTSASGGYGVPVLIDPTIILTAGAAGVPVLDICRIVTITTDAWKGVSGAGVSWSYDAEGSAVSDDSITLAQPNIPVYTARGFVPFSIEIGMDYPGFEDEMRRVLAQGYLDLLAAQTVTGSGSSSPRGIFTAIVAAGASKQVITTTDGVFGAIDVQALYAAVPERFRSKATWLMNVGVENQIRAFPTSSNFGFFTVDLTKDGIAVLNGRPVRQTDYAPNFTGTTGQASIALLGDFSNFVVAQRAGMNVELIPNLFDVTNNRPTGQRGLFAWSRHGFDSVADNAFRVLVNT